MARYTPNILITSHTTAPNGLPVRMTRTVPWPDGEDPASVITRAISTGPGPSVWLGVEIVGLTSDGRRVTLVYEGLQYSGPGEKAGVAYSVAPAVDMGATLMLHTDRDAYTITRIGPSGRVLWARADKATRTDRNGLSEQQTYAYEPDPSAPEERFDLGVAGWRGRRGRLAVGERRTYRDPSF